MPYLGHARGPCVGLGKIGVNGGQGKDHDFEKPRKFYVISGTRCNRTGIEQGEAVLCRTQGLGYDLGKRRRGKRAG